MSVTKCQRENVDPYLERRAILTLLCFKVDVCWRQQLDISQDVGFNLAMENVFYRCDQTWEWGHRNSFSIFVKASNCSSYTDWTTGFRSPAGGRRFFLYPVREVTSWLLIKLFGKCFNFGPIFYIFFMHFKIQRLNGSAQHVILSQNLISQKNRPNGTWILHFQTRVQALFEMCMYYQR